MPGDVRRRWDPGRRASTEVANPSNKGNGMTLDADGRLIVCEHVTSSVVRIDPTARARTRDARHSLRRSRSSTAPTTSIVTSDGSIYFTDPTYGRMPGFGIEREQELDFQGVYRIAPGAVSLSCS